MTGPDPRHSVRIGVLCLDLGEPSRYRLKAQDLITLIEALSFAILCLAFPAPGFTRLIGLSLPAALPKAALFLCFAALALAAPLADRARNPLLTFLRIFYPQALYLSFFSESILLSCRVFGGRSHDAVFAAFDQLVFGFQPSILFHRYMPSWFGEIMFASYFVYYVILIITPWILWLVKGRSQADDTMYLFTGLTALVTLFYVFFRVQGPKYWFPELNAAWYDNFKGGLFTGLMRGIFDTSTLCGAAFPSTHIMASIMTLVFARRIDRRLFALYIPQTILVSLATVYIYAHYAADVFGAVITFALLFPLLKSLRPRIENRALKLGLLLAREKQGAGKRP